MRFSYGANVLDIKVTELTKYFTFNKYVSQNSSNNKLLTHSIDGKQWPVLKLNQEAINLLTKK